MKAILLLAFTCALSANAIAQNLEPAIIETMSGERVGYKNAKGEVVIKPRFEVGNKFSDGYATVCIGGKCGMIDSTGKEVIPLKYREIGYFQDGLAGVSLDGRKFGFINRAGAMVIPMTLDGVSDFSEGRATAMVGGKCALINKQGTLLTPYKYQGMEEMKGGIARVCLRNDSRDGIQFANLWGFINAQGREISKLNNYGYESPNLENGYAVTRMAKLDVVPANLNTRQRSAYAALIGRTHSYSSALIDKTGRVVIPATANYEFGDWEHDYIIVKRGDAYGVVDMAGKVILAIGFREISRFEYGPDKRSLAKVFTTADGKFFYVDRHFKCVEFDGVKCPEY